jgi:hypothetical protein
MYSQQPGAPQYGAQPGQGYPGQGFPGQTQPNAYPVMPPHMQQPQMQQPQMQQMLPQQWPQQAQQQYAPQQQWPQQVPQYAPQPGAPVQYVQGPQPVYTPGPQPVYPQQMQPVGYGYAPSPQQPQFQQAYAPVASPSSPPPGYFAQAQPKEQPMQLEAIPALQAAPTFDAAEKPSQKTGWTDWQWAAAFWLHLLAVTGIALGLGVPAVMRASARVDDGGGNGGAVNVAIIFKLLLVASAVGAVSAATFLACLHRFANCLISCALYGTLVVFAIMTAAFFALNTIMGIVMAVVLLIMMFCVWSWRKHIPFATANVKTAVAAISANPSVICFALSMIGVQFVWSVLWNLMAVGLSDLAAGPPAGNATRPLGAPMGGGQNSTNAAGQLGVLFASTLSLTWGSQCFAYVSQFVVASVVGSWWFQNDSKKAVSAGISRAFTTNFGSISLAAFIVAAIRAARAVADAIRDAARKNDAPLPVQVLACLCACIVGCIEGIVRLISDYVIAVVAITGAPFWSSAKTVFKLWQDRGWELIINENLVGPALFLASFAPAIVSALVGALFSVLSIRGTFTNPNADTYAIVGAILSFIIGLLMALVMTNIISGAVQSVFVCFALNPAALQATHPEQYNQLMEAWLRIYPQQMQSCGYQQMYVAQLPQPGQVLVVQQQVVTGNPAVAKKAAY